jgi:hypothetical protein
MTHESCGITHFAPMCRRMTETQFWSRYFQLVDGLIDSQPASPAAPAADVSSRPGSAPPTSKSALSGWEDVRADDGEPGAGSPERHAAGDGDDLDKYLQVRPAPHAAGAVAYCNVAVAASSTTAWTHARATALVEHMSFAAGHAGWQPCGRQRVRRG